jgi:glycogen(starch) synthase
VWRHIFDLGAGLRDRGHEVIVAGAPHVEHAPRLQFAHVGLGDLARLRPDVLHIHLHDTFERRALYLIAVGRTYGSAVVCTEHLPRTNASDPRLLAAHPRHRGAATLKAVFKRFEYMGSSRMIVVSEGSRRFMLERFGIDGGRVRVVPHGILVPCLPKPAPSRPTLEVVSIGSLIDQKGHDVLVEAAERATEPMCVTIYGEGPRHTKLERAARRLDGRVRVHGWTDQPSAAIRAANVLCVPSRWEASSYVALEAMAEGRAVVASAVDGLEDIVDNGRTGVLVDPEDSVGLAAALDRLAMNPNACAAMGQAGYERVTRRFSLERMVSATIDVYDEAHEAYSRRRIGRLGW